MDMAITPNLEGRDMDRKTMERVASWYDGLAVLAAAKGDHLAATAHRERAAAIRAVASDGVNA